MALVMDGARASARLERAIENWEMRISELRRALDSVVLIEVLDDFLDLFGIVADALERARDRLVDDFQHPAADQLFVFHQRDVGLDAGGIAIHHERDGAGRGDDGCLRIAISRGLAKTQRLVPRLARRAQQIERHIRRVELVSMTAMTLDDLEHGLAIDSVS